MTASNSGPRTVGQRRRKRASTGVDSTAFHDAILLREGDHRIKNSLQIVIGLMRLQARRSGNALVSDALLAASARVEAIARMHDTLRRSASGEEVDIGSVIEVMCRSLQAMAGDAHTVAIVFKVESIKAPVALAQPILLAVNELVINALRHAFPEGGAGTVTVSAHHCDGQLRFVVADDGAGLPADHAARTGYGMKLVRMMVAQIGGALQMENDHGARFTLTATAPATARSREAQCCRGETCVSAAG